MHDMLAWHLRDMGVCEQPVKRTAAETDGGGVGAASFAACFTDLICKVPPKHD